MGYDLKKYLLVTEKPWHDDLFNKLFAQDGQVWKRIKQKDNLNYEIVKDFNPDFIFIPHWSYIITSNIYLNWNCVVFHMTDLPFGRGGSPLQNLILLGLKTTKISAIKIDDGIDTGDIYLKKKLKLDGSAFNIFQKSSKIIYKMINEIINKNITPKPQIGEPIIFKRRKYFESKIDSQSELNDIYDKVRMLDCDGYPRAFIEEGNVIYEFRKIRKINNNILEANVRIFKK